MGERACLQLEGGDPLRREGVSEGLEPPSPPSAPPGSRCVAVARGAGSGDCRGRSALYTTLLRARGDEKAAPLAHSALETFEAPPAEPNAEVGNHGRLCRSVAAFWAVSWTFSMCSERRSVCGQACIVWTERGRVAEWQCTYCC